MTDTSTTPSNGQRNWSAGFMPAIHQGLRLNHGKYPIKHLSLPEGIILKMRDKTAGLLYQLNKEHLHNRKSNSELEAGIRSYGLAYKMQAPAPKAVDFTKETEATKKLYGFGNEDTKPFGRCFLRARRLVKLGTQFVDLSWSTE